ncbi:uncharacterized protein LOC124861183 [Girardinichthys multiradiatus]|uniref:uncharacterized protein LOC124861183 n=1 Tax=Girardinichthys multiradiatus TaxID=208333 RepID=UPI001FAD3299|nr:uncharacterized protein LOC124861183 [Girardinichthys multiradiatus]
MWRLIKRILGFLIPARAIMGVPLKEVEYGEGHQLADEELFIGAETKAFMARKELPVSAEKKIFQSVRRFYEAVLQKMFSSFPLDHPLLKDMKVLDPAARLDITPGTVARLGALFPQLSLSEDRLREELIDYQVTDSKHLPQEDKTDRFWGLVGKDVRFSELPRLMEALQCIPHSNASSERVFSMLQRSPGSKSGSQFWVLSSNQCPTKRKNQKLCVLCVSLYLEFAGYFSQFCSTPYHHTISVLNRTVEQNLRLANRRGSPALQYHWSEGLALNS